MDSVAHDGRETAYRRVDRADGQLVCYVHGSGGTHRAWGGQFGPGGIHTPAVALDLSGHGASDDVALDGGPERLDAYARDAAAVVAETDADVLVGHSLGGAVVLEAVLEGYCSVDALVCSGTAADLSLDERLLTLLAEDVAAALEYIHGPDRLFHDADEDRLERSIEEMWAAGPETLRRDVLSAHAFDARERLDRIAVPTLAVCGEHDTLTTPADHEFLAENVKRGELAVISDAAHLVMVERAAAFNRTVEGFLG